VRLFSLYLFGYSERLQEFEECEARMTEAKIALATLVEETKSRNQHWRNVQDALQYRLGDRAQPSQSDSPHADLVRSSSQRSIPLSVNAASSVSQPASATQAPLTPMQQRKVSRDVSTKSNSSNASSVISASSISHSNTLQVSHAHDSSSSVGAPRSPSVMRKVLTSQLQTQHSEESTRSV
jgi:hypothetical protein